VAGHPDPKRKRASECFVFWQVIRPGSGEGSREFSRPTQEKTIRVFQRAEGYQKSKTPSSLHRDFDNSSWGERRRTKFF